LHVIHFGAKAVVADGRVLRVVLCTKHLNVSQIAFGFRPAFQAGLPTRTVSSDNGRPEGMRAFVSENQTSSSRRVSNTDANKPRALSRGAIPERSRDCIIRPRVTVAAMETGHRGDVTGRRTTVTSDDQRNRYARDVTAHSSRLRRRYPQTSPRDTLGRVYFARRTLPGGCTRPAEGSGDSERSCLRRLPTVAAATDQLIHRRCVVINNIALDVRKYSKLITPNGGIERRVVSRPEVSTRFDPGVFFFCKTPIWICVETNFEIIRSIR